MGLGIAIAKNGMPDAALTEASTVEVHERMGEPTTYRIRYPVDIHEDDLPWLIEGKLDPGSELSVLVPVDDTVHCLVKGPVVAQQIHLDHGGPGSWIEVTGSDTSSLMDRETKAAVWIDVKDSDVVSSILSSYGYILDVETTDSMRVENKHALVQRDSDLRFVRRLARRNGFLFWVTCDTVGVETAHFKKPPLDGEATVELSVNREFPSIDSLDINWDMERPTAMSGAQLDLNTLSNIDGSVGASPQRPLGSRALGAIVPGAQTVHLAAPADDAGDLQARGRAVLTEADWFLRASCQTTLERLGTLVRAHTVVEVTGAGSRHSGTYFVAGVRHTMDSARHVMDIELLRNGWES